MKRARIGLVGTGWWATNTHLPALQAHPAAVIAAVCDLDAAKLRQTRDAFQIAATYTDCKTLLQRETLDGVMVATHHAAHYPVAKACLESGLHVFIEKPMTLRAMRARALVELAAARDRQIVMGYHHNHSRLAMRARDVVQGGELGAIQYINGLFGQHVQPLLAGRDEVHEAKLHTPGDVYSDPIRSGGGHGHLQLTHLAGLLFFVTDLRIARVHSLMANHGLRVDLVNAISAEFEGGALATLGGSSNMPGGGRAFRLTVHGERGRLELDDGAGALVIRRSGAAPETLRQPELAESQDDLTFAPTHNFVDLILGRAANKSGGEIGWRATELLDAAYRSAAQEGAAIRRAELYGEQIA